MLRTVVLWGAAVLRGRPPTKRKIAKAALGNEKGAKTNAKPTMSAKVPKRKGRPVSKSSPRPAPSGKQREKQEREAERLFLRMIREERRRRQAIIWSAARRAASRRIKEESSLVRQYAANKQRALAELERLKRGEAAEVEVPGVAPAAAARKQRAPTKWESPEIKDEKIAFRRKMESEAEKKFMQLVERLSKKRNEELRAAAALLKKQRAAQQVAASGDSGGKPAGKVWDAGSTPPVVAVPNETPLVAHEAAEAVEALAAEEVATMRSYPKEEAEFQAQQEVATVTATPEGEERMEVVPTPSAVAKGRRKGSARGERKVTVAPTAVAAVAKAGELLPVVTAAEVEEPTMADAAAAGGVVDDAYEVAPAEVVEAKKPIRQRRPTSKLAKAESTAAPVVDLPISGLIPASAVDQALPVDDNAHVLVNQQPNQMFPVAGYADAPLLPAASPAVPFVQRGWPGVPSFDIPVIPLRSNPMEALIRSTRGVTTASPAQFAINIPAARPVVSRPAANTGLLRL